MSDHPDVEKRHLREAGRNRPMRTNGGGPPDLELTLSPGAAAGWKAVPSAGQPWGETATAKFSGDGSPVGVFTPTEPGDLYVDETTPALWQASGVTDADWLPIGLPTGWTQDGNNPANLDSQGGGLLAYLFGRAAAGGQGGFFFPGDAQNGAGGSPQIEGGLGAAGQSGGNSLLLGGSGDGGNVNGATFSARGGQPGLPGWPVIGMNGEQISIQMGRDVTDPTISPGVNGYRGSLYICRTTPATLWFKLSSTNTDWVKISP